MLNEYSNNVRFQADKQDSNGLNQYLERQSPIINGSYIVKNANKDVMNHRLQSVIIKYSEILTYRITDQNYQLRIITLTKVLRQLSIMLIGRMQLTNTGS